MGTMSLGSAHRLQHHLASVEPVAADAKTALVGELGPEAGGIEFGGGQSRPLAQGTAVAQQVREAMIGEPIGRDERTEIAKIKARGYSFLLVKCPSWPKTLFYC